MSFGKDAVMRLCTWLAVPAHVGIFYSSIDKRPSFVNADVKLRLKPAELRRKHNKYAQNRHSIGLTLAHYYGADTDRRVKNTHL